MLRSLITASLLLICASPALAEQWVYIGTSQDNRAFFVDFDSVRGSGSDRNFWVRAESASTGRAINLTRIEVNCTFWESSLMEIYSYSDYTIPRRAVNPYPARQAIPDGTVMSEIAGFICERATGAHGLND